MVADSMAALSKALEKLHRKDEAKKYQAMVRGILAFSDNPAYSGNTVDITSFQRKAQ